MKKESQKRFENGSPLKDETEVDPGAPGWTR